MNLFSTLRDISDFLGDIAGLGIGRREIILNCEGERLALPVTPSGYDVRTGQNNKVVNVVEFGEALVFGNSKLKTISLSGFFPHPAHRYPFAKGDESNPNDLVALIESWKESKKPVRLIITDSSINLAMAIMEFNYNEKDGTRDIYFTLELTEYKDLNTPPANNDKQIDETTGLKKRNINKTQQQALNLKHKLDDVMDKGKRITGAYSHLKAGNISQAMKKINGGK